MDAGLAGLHARPVQSLVLSALLLALAGCASTPEELEVFSRSFNPPEEIRVDGGILKPLSPEHAERDYHAVMANREHLQRTLAWGDWPRADFTLEQNRRDVARHWLEFQGHAGYTYTLLSPDRRRCLGCVYLEPPDPESEVAGARLFFWVAEEEEAHDLDRRVVAAVLERFGGPQAPLERIVVPILRTNARGLALAESLGLQRAGERGERILFLHRRPPPAAR